MQLIAHRVNTIAMLDKIPEKYGVEIDLRDYEERLILQHDPFKDGENFEKYLQHYKHSTIILNIKSERIEFRALELLKKYKVDNYFFLDCSFPMIYLLTKQGENNISLRFSEFEGLDTIMIMKNKIKWVWVDCFSKLPIDVEIYRLLKNADMKLCLVSPELSGREGYIGKYKKYLEEKHIFFDAVCTKIYNIEKWL